MTLQKGVTAYVKSIFSESYPAPSCSSHNRPASMRFLFSLVLVAAIFLPVIVQGQVVETSPNPPRTDRSVTLYFDADEGTGGLADLFGGAYAPTGISTVQNGDGAWKCVKNHWSIRPSFLGNRSDTKLTRAATSRYKLEISDIRAYDENTSTSCSLGSNEEIQTMNLVFRNADGRREGEAEGGSHIFVDVIDLSGGRHSWERKLTGLSADPLLYPFIASTDTTVPVSIAADTANVNSVSSWSLLVDGSSVKANSKDSLGYALTMNDVPNHYHIQAVAEADTGAGTIRDTAETVLIRTPNVVTQARPSDVEDGINEQSASRVTLSLNAPNKDFQSARNRVSWDPS